MNVIYYQVELSGGKIKMVNMMNSKGSFGFFSLSRKQDNGQDDQGKSEEIVAGCNSPEDCRRMLNDRNTFNVLF